MLSSETARKPQSELQMTIKSKESTLAVILMAADTQLRKGGMEGFCDNPYPNSTPTAPKSNSLRKESIKENS